MPVDNLSDRLAALAAQFDAVEPATGSMFEPPPPNDYDGLVHEFDFFEGGNPTQAFVKVRLLTQQSTDGNTQYGGRYAEVVNSLEDPERLPFLKALFDTLAGGQPYRLTDIAPETPFLISLLDVPVRFRVAESKKVNQETGKPYLNVYVKERTGQAVRQGDVGQRASMTPTAGAAVEAELAQQLTQQQAPQGSVTGEPPTVEGQPLPKVEGCICPAPEKGKFDERCTVPGHGIPFHHEEAPLDFAEFKSHATRPF